MALARAAGPTDVPLWESTIGAALDRAVAAHPERDALIVCHQDVRLSWSELADEVDRVARGLLARGARPGDRLGIWSPNHAEWVLTQLATARIGVVLVTLNPAYRTHEVAYALELSGCRFLVAASSFKTSDYRAMVDEVRGDLPALEQVIWLDTDDWADLVAAGDAHGVAVETVAAVEAGLTPGDAINIQFTSGTTGFPKGATLSHRNILNNGWFVGEGCRYTEVDRVCIPVPLYHCFGMVMGVLGCVTHGAAMVFPAPAFEPAATLRAVEEQHCTSLYGVPTMFIAELGDPTFAERDLSTLRTGIMAGSPCPVEVMKRCIAEMHMDEVTICYGMTETSPVSTQTAADDDLERRVASVGRVHPHVEIQVVDPDGGSVVERGATGELCTRSYSVMLGYWDDPERTAEAIDADGWMHTGDLAVMDDDGYVGIVGRSKDMVIRGGENIYPREVEEFLHTHPAIVDVQVIGVPDERYGEELMAWVVLAEDAALDIDALREFCADRIAHQKVPRYLHVTDEFPMTVTGKVQKYKMRDDAIDLLGLHAAADTRTA